MSELQSQILVYNLSESVSSKRCFGKGVGNSENASEMRQECAKNGSCFIGEKRNVPKCVRNASKIAPKMRGTPLGENTFWTIPTEVLSELLLPEFCMHISFHSV